MMVINLIILMLCAITLVISLRIHEKVTPGKPEPFWLKNKNAQPNPDGAAKDAAPPPDAKPDSDDNPTGKPDDKSKDSGTGIRSPIPGPDEDFIGPMAPNELRPLRATVPPPQPGEIVPWYNAPKHYGRTITVEGKIVQTNNIGNLCFLNFTKEPRGGDKFYFVIYREAYDAWNGKPEEALLNKTIRVTGEISDHNGRVQMKITDGKQLEVVE